MTADRTWILARPMLLAGGVLALLATAAPLRSPLRPAPVRQPAVQATAWMADSLPGIGAKRRDAAVAALRAGRLADLPAPARSAAGEAFILP